MSVATRFPVPRATTLVVLAALLLSACGGPAPGPAPRPMAVPVATGPEFCGGIQQVLAGTRQVALNTVQASFDGFVKSKPHIQPLETQQYVEYADGGKTRPMLISCKTKSADHINAAYGPGSALDDLYSCRAINRSILLGAWAALPPEQRASARWTPAQVMLDADDAGFMGAEFIKPYRFLYLGADGLPHVRAKAQYAGWNDWKWKVMPERFRGTHYCRLIAPEYARDVFSGAVTVTPLAPPPG